MNKICTSIEQSEKLVELGIDVKKADMIYNTLDVSYVRHDTPIDKYHTPAWSLAALMELTPNDVSLLHLEDVFQAVYDIKPYHITNRFNNPLDAVFEMIVWLKENGKI